DLINVIKNIIFLPIDFSESDNSQSIYSLLKNTGYFSVHSKINENTILQVLTNYMDCIEYWFYWSDNKRNNDGWFFLRGNDTYVVGNIGSNGQIIEKFEFNNVVEACSFFIKKEIESIRKS